MKSCSHLEADDYPCPEEGTVRVDGKLYCEEHALEHELGDDDDDLGEWAGRDDDLGMFADEDLPDVYVPDDDMSDF